MDDEYGEAMPSLQLAQVRKQGSDFAAGVFVDAVQAYKRIQQVCLQLQRTSCLFDTAAIEAHMPVDNRYRIAFMVIVDVE